MVVTTQSCLPDVDDKAYIKVAELEPEEAEDLICRLLPDSAVNHESAAELAKALGSHALAIKVACGLLTDNEELTIASLCSPILLENSALLFDSKGKTQYPRLTELCRRTWVRLADESPQATELLSLIVFLHNSHIPVDLLTACMASTFRYPPTHPLTKSLTRQAISVIENRHLIQREESGLSIHQLVQAILYGLIAQQPKSAEVIRNKLRRGIQVYLKQKWQEFPSSSRLEFVRSQAFMKLHLWRVETSPSGAASEREIIRAMVSATKIILDAINPGGTVPLRFNPSEFQPAALKYLVELCDSSAGAGIILYATEPGVEIERRMNTGHSSQLPINILRIYPTHLIRNGHQHGEWFFKKSSQVAYLPSTPHSGHLKTSVLPLVAAREQMFTLLTF